MNRQRFVFIFLFSISTVFVSAQQVNLQTADDSASYFIGYVYGSQMAKSGADALNAGIIARGWEDALNNKELAIDQNEMNTFMQRYFMNIQARIAEKNLSEGQAFLEANGKKPGVLTLPSGLQYKIIRAGAGDTPGKDDKVELFYHGTLIDGTVFDSAKERGEPATFSPKDVIPGFTEALMLMNEGSLWEIYIPAELGYGQNVNPSSGIKPNSVLIFEIEVLNIEKAENETEE